MRTRSASSIDSGLCSGNSGTKLSTASRVSLSMNTCLMNWSAEKQSTGSASPQEPWGNWARICSQYLPALARHLPAGSTMWVCTSKMNSSPASTLSAAAVSNAASPGRRKAPPVLPRAANAWLSVSSVVAAPHSDCRNARRATPTRRACAVMRSPAAALARATVSVSGTGRNSPFEVASILIGSLLALGPDMTAHLPASLSLCQQRYRQRRADQARRSSKLSRRPPVYSLRPTA